MNVLLAFVYLSIAALLYHGGKDVMYPFARIVIAILWPAVLVTTGILRAAEHVGLA